jgi:putative oxidoreductase
MSLAEVVHSPHLHRPAIARPLELLATVTGALAAPFAFATRLYVSWQFLKSGWLKLSSWDVTLDLFRYEYHTPLLSPEIAAVAGTTGELLFPVLLILGLGGRLGAVGLFAVNVMAVVSYAHVLLSPGFEAAVGQHYLWGFMLATLVVYGTGAWSLDRWLAPRLGASRSW